MSVPQNGRELHIDQALSGLLIGRRPVGFIADEFVPVRTVEKQTDFYYRYDHMIGRRYEAGLTARAPGTTARRVQTKVGTDVYVARNYALGADWTVEDAVNADAVLNWAERNAKLVQDMLLMDYEWRIADMAVNTSNVGTVTTIASAWSDAANSRPFDDINLKIEAFRQRTGLKPNTLILPEQVAVRLRNNAQFRDILFGDRGGLVTPQQIAGLFSLERVLLPSAQVNTQDESATFNGSGTLSDVWGPHAWLAHVNPAAGSEIDTWFSAFRWTNPLFGTPWGVQRFPFDPRRKIYELEVHYYQSEKVISRDLAERITNVVSL